eukprot:scaffold24629_cov71-Skeletonema_dohrnii-CCMP3373.AAC.3
MPIFALSMCDGFAFTFSYLSSSFLQATAEAPKHSTLVYCCQHLSLHSFSINLSSSLSTILTTWQKHDVSSAQILQTLQTTFEGDLCCASCDIVKVDEVQLSKCPACDLVQYCSIECQREHKPQRKQACEKRAAELREEILFNQPEGSHLGDCPICLLPLPLDCRKSRIMSCCYKKSAMAALTPMI